MGYFISPTYGARAGTALMIRIVLLARPPLPAAEGRVQWPPRLEDRPQQDPGTRVAANGRSGGVYLCPQPTASAAGESLNSGGGVDKILAVCYS